MTETSKSPVPWAIITGASSGIGAELAPMLAERGFNLVLVARRRERLQALADKLRASKPGLEVQILELDLCRAGAVSELLAACPQNFALLVNNAGVGQTGPAVENPIEGQLALIQLNVTALTELTLRLAPKMTQGAQILNVASVVGFMPVPQLAVYAATKAFVLSFSEALDHELRPRGIRCKALCPGATETEFYDRAETPGRRIRRSSLILMSAQSVAREAIRLIDSRATTRVTGWLNKLLTFTPRLLPRRWMTAISGQFTPARGAAS
jgi:short-subunit dehydrogenase